MDSKFTPIFDFVSNNYLDHTFLIIYIINLILSIIAYKLGFARQLPLLKSIFVYILLIIGTFITTIFSTLFLLPIPESLVIISLVLAIYRFRLHRERQAEKS